MVHGRCYHTPVTAPCEPHPRPNTTAPAAPTQTNGKEEPLSESNIKDMISMLELLSWYVPLGPHGAASMR